MVGCKNYQNILEALAILPEDGDLSRLHSVSLDSAEEDTGSPETLHEDTCNDPYNSQLTGSFIPSTTQRMIEEQETVRHSV